MVNDAEMIERRLNAGEWLMIGDVAILLGVDRTTVDRMLKTTPPKLSWRFRSGTGRYRELNPEDVRRELNARRTVHGKAVEDPTAS